MKSSSIPLLWRAIRIWWREFAILLMLNLLWLIAQATVLFGPPATAALVAMADRLVEDELVDFADFGRALLAHFGVAWLWGLAQVVIYGVLGFNLVAYTGAEGVVFLALRYTWTLMAAAWFAINLYFWPLYFI